MLKIIILFFLKNNKTKMEKINKNDKWIFLVPVDGNANKNTIENKNQSFEEQNKKNDIEIEKDENIEEIYNNDYFDIEKIPNNKKIKEKQNNVKIYSSSLISKNISIADSSKIYMSEFLKKNWKIKIKRLIIKLKKRYTKQVQKSILEEDNKSSNISNKTENSKFIENYNSINFDDNSKLLHQNYNNCNQIINNNINNINFQNYNNNNLNISKNQQNYHNSYIDNNNNIKNKEINNSNDNDNF